MSDRPDKEWEKDVASLAKKVLKVVTGYTGADAVAAIAIVLKHIAEKNRDVD
jgi:Holliday junction resolvasome RuvABC endonuclease subunit